jgi:hypothetical protein
MPHRSDLVRDTGVDSLCIFNIRQLANGTIFLFDPYHIRDAVIPVHLPGFVHII